MKCIKIIRVVTEYNNIIMSPSRLVVDGVVVLELH